MPRLFIEGPTGIADVVQLQIPRTTVGRSLANTIVLDDLRVSRLHAVIDLEAPFFIVKDLWSKNGVYLNGRKVHARALSSGDTLNVGDCSIRFIAEKDYEEAVAEPLGSIPGFQMHRMVSSAP
ncbi:FHA domain-containing protein [Variovorax sp. PBL-E5]|uniref:FHA domain-containing protein n=1 Tax=Variovorax sp. PBL-E5 TaxID=434014 RepID=UPI0013173F60|nr:FHA domain-containing protein [Variovorax sp. PBL-E5]VTU36202.1 Oxoglutarate dehydrogenase inhibitor [Variovorax sp. PBL-E5]